MRAIVVDEAGGAESLALREVPDPVPGPGELLVRTRAIGVNFIDTYRRSGVYPTPFPHIPGVEGSGEVVAVGPDVVDHAVGDHVAWVDAPSSYAELVVVPDERALPMRALPFPEAAALGLQGMTAHYLAFSTYRIQPRDAVLVHAAAGGVGLMLTQLATLRRGTVVGTVSSPEKAALARSAGAAEVIRYDELTDLTAQLPELVREVTGGGAHVVYDGVGRATFDASLASLRRRGLLVLYGGSSGQVPAFDPQRLNAAGSVYLTRPTLAHYVDNVKDLQRRWAALRAWVTGGILDVRIGATFGLADAAGAHLALEGRATTGKVLLVP